jgi:hypothetical protein
MSKIFTLAFTVISFIFSSVLFANSLEALKSTLDENIETLTALIPDLYAFEEGETGTNIGDGGDDMYDTGNQLNTDLTAAIQYTNGQIADGGVARASRIRRCQSQLQ